jgi:hypothetical protein
VTDPLSSDQLVACAAGFMFGLNVAAQALGFELSRDANDKILRQLKRIADGEEVVGLFTAAELKLRGIDATPGDMNKAIMCQRLFAKELCLALSESFKAFGIALPADQ